MDQEDDHPQPQPVPEVAKRKPYVAPTLTLYGNLQQIVGMVGTTGIKDGAFGVMNVRTSP